MTAQEIRTIRAVLNAILAPDEKELATEPAPTNTDYGKD